MTTLKFIIGALPSAIIPVGIREENDVSAVEVDFSAWAEEFGAGVMQLLVKRSGDTSAYPVVLTQTGTAATWTLSSTDLAKTGELLAEYVYTVSGQVKKSCVLRFFVVPDIGTPGSAPDPYQSWLSQLTALAAQTEEAAAAILNMTVEAQTLAPGSAATVTKTVDAQTGAVTLTFGIPGGEAASPYTSNPAALGTASPGLSDDYARGDHVHPKPSASDIGAATPEDLLPLYPHATATGSVASFSDGADDIPVRDLTVAVAPAQNLNGYDSPWPAGGGKNKLPLPSSAIEKNGVTVESTAAGEIWIHGTPDISSGYINFSNVGIITSSIDGQTVTVSINEKTVGVGFAFGSAGSLNFTMSDTATTKSGTFTAGGHAFEITIRYDVGSINKKYKIQLELGSSATTFAPYSNVCPITGWTGANVYHEDEYDAGADPALTISWQSAAGTVYGGTLDVTTGVLTVTHGTITGLNALSWDKRTGEYDYDYFAANFNDKKAGSTSMFCSQYKTATGGRNTLTSNCMIAPYNISNSKVLCIRNDAYSDATTFAASLANVQLVYELATPVTYQLTPAEVKTLLGDNAIWADTGDSSVDYRADPTLFVQNAIAAAVAAL